MPFIAAVVGAVVSAVGAVVGAIGGVLGLGAGLGSLVGGLALSAGLSLVGQLLRPSTKPPPARGSVTQVVIDPNAPQPYAMGEGLVGATVRFDYAYGPTITDVPNPFRYLVVVHSGGGPIEEMAPRFDQNVIDMGYYGDTGEGAWLGFDSQLGACPESTALYPALYGGIEAVWDDDSKLSGFAAHAFNMRFDRDGKVWSGGVPQIGAYGKWVKCYDPRLDSTFPGGSGAHRLGDETTYEWTANPALHSGTYAYGRWQNGKRVLGIGAPADAIDWAVIVAWANVCVANEWQLFGVVSEGGGDPGERWNNLKDIAAAGGGVPVVSGGLLSFHYQAPRVSVATITEADIADDDCSVTGMRSWRDRINTLIPRYIEPASNWELVAAEPVVVSSYLADDGEERRVEWPFNLVKDVDQAAQLARYVIEDSRELQPIELPVGPHLRGLRPGHAVDLDLPQLGLDTQAVILRREFDPAKLTVKLTLIGETPGKHAFALGETGTPPPAPSLGMTGEQRDDILFAVARVPAEPGADVTANHQIVVTVPTEVKVFADHAGTITTGQLPKIVDPVLTKGGTDIRTLDTTTYVLDNVSPSLTDIDLDNTDGSPTKGRISVNAMDGTGSATLLITVDGVALQPITIKFVLTATAPPTSSPSGGSFSAAGEAIDSTSYSEVGRISGVTIGAGQTINAALTSSYYGYAGEITAKWQRSAAGAESWSDMGTAATGTPCSWWYNIGTGAEGFIEGAVTCNRSTSPGAGAYDIRLLALTSSDGLTTNPGYPPIWGYEFAANVTVS